MQGCWFCATASSDADDRHAELRGELPAAARVAAPAWPAVGVLRAAVAERVASPASAAIPGVAVAAQASSPASAVGPGVKAAAARSDAAAARASFLASAAVPVAKAAAVQSGAAAVLAALLAVSVRYASAPAVGPPESGGSAAPVAQSVLAWWGARAACGSVSLPAVKQAGWAALACWAARVHWASRPVPASPVALQAGRGVRPWAWDAWLHGHRGSRRSARP